MSELAEVSPDPYQTFRGLIDEWAQRLDNSAHPTDLAKRAMAELDEACPFIDEQCNYAGMAVRPEVTVDSGTGRATAEEVYGPAVGEGRSEGVDIFPLQPGQPPKIWFRFLLGEDVTMPLRTIVDRRQLYCFVDPEQCSIQPHDPIDTIFTYESYLQPDVSMVELLNERSEQLRRYLASTAFRRLSRVTQNRRIGSFIERTEREVAIRDRRVLMDPKYAYRVSTLHEELWYAPIGLNRIGLSGTCLAVDLLGRSVLDERGIRRDSDLVDKRGGLFLAIELDEESELPTHGDIGPRSVLHVPISGQTFDAFFFPRGTTYAS